MADGSLRAAGTEAGNDSGAIYLYTHTNTHCVHVFLDFLGLLFTFLYFLSSFLWNKVFIFSFYIFFKRNSVDFYGVS